MKILVALILIIEFSMCADAYAQLLFGIDSSAVHGTGNCGSLNFSTSSACTINLLTTGAFT